MLTEMIIQLVAHGWQWGASSFSFAVRRFVDITPIAFDNTLLSRIYSSTVVTVDRPYG
jgi:hypothetical protein